MGALEIRRPASVPKRKYKYYCQLSDASQLVIDSLQYYIGYQRTRISMSKLLIILFYRQFLKFAGDFKKVCLICDFSWSGFRLTESITTNQAVWRRLLLIIILTFQCEIRLGQMSKTELLCNSLKNHKINFSKRFLKRILKRPKNYNIPRLIYVFWQIIT